MKFGRLEALRGFAASYVCIGHIIHADSIGAAGYLLRFGQEAVMIFFVLSGFVVSWTTDTDGPRKQRFQEYFRKRFFRIYTVWFLAVLAMFAISSVESRRIVFPSFGVFVGNLFMLQDFSYGKPAVICEPIFGDTPLWSLHYEWWFYMMFPLVLLIDNPRKRLHFVGISAASASLCYAFFPNPICRLLMYFSVWYIGAQAAICLRQNGRVRLSDMTAPLLYVLLSSLPLIALVCSRSKDWHHLQWGIHPILEARHLVSAVGFVLLAFGWRSIQWVGFSHSIGVFTAIAPISFSLYVIHYRSIATARYLSFINSRPVELLLYLVLTLCFCVVSEIVIYQWVRKKINQTERREVPVVTQ